HPAPDPIGRRRAAQRAPAPGARRSQRSRPTPAVVGTEDRPSPTVGYLQTPVTPLRVGCATGSRPGTHRLPRASLEVATSQVRRIPLEPSPRTYGVAPPGRHESAPRRRRDMAPLAGRGGATAPGAGRGPRGH